MKDAKDKSDDGYSEDEFDMSPPKPSAAKDTKPTAPKGVKKNSLESVEKPSLGAKKQNTIKETKAKVSNVKRNQDEGNVLLKSKEASNKNDDYDDDFEDVDKSLEKKNTQRRMLPPKVQSNRSHLVSPKAPEDFLMKPNMSISTNIDRYKDSSKKARLSNTIVSSSDGMQNFNKSSMKTYLHKQMKLNVLQSIQHDLHGAKKKLRHANKLRHKAESSGGDSQLILLNKENLMLKDELKHMSKNLNKFIGIPHINNSRFDEGAQGQEEEQVQEVQPLDVHDQAGQAESQGFREEDLRADHPEYEE